MRVVDSGESLGVVGDASEQGHVAARIGRGAIIEAVEEPDRDVIAARELVIDFEQVTIEIVIRQIYPISLAIRINILKLNRLKASPCNPI